jgi:hypothetical protein
VVRPSNIDGLRKDLLRRWRLSRRLLLYFGLDEIVASRNKRDRSSHKHTTHPMVF